MPNQQPIRVFEGTAKPHEPFWQFRDSTQTDSGQTELEFYGPISEFSWFGDEVTPKMFKEQLHKNGSAPVTVRLNSPGGDLIAASVISAMIKDYPGKVTVKVDGMAASAAVMVALAGDVVAMNASAYMMIHNPMVGLLGYYNVDELKSLIDELKSIKNGVVEGYMTKTNLDAEKIAKLMDAETWMTASEAVSYGFADEIITTSSKSNITNYVNSLTNYVNVPQALLPREENVEAEPMPESSEQAAAKPDPRKVATLRNYLKVYVNKKRR